MSLSKKLELPATILVLLCGAAFLLKMCYLSLFLNCVCGLGLLTIFYLYARARHSLNVPLVLMGLVFAALQVDALGNYFHMYGSQFGPFQYDEFSHLTVQVLVTPLFVWLVKEGLTRWDYKLSIPLTTFFAGTIIFSLSAFYEIIELWDEVYAGGHRIWGPYDTANDLQWDLCGIVVGTLLAHFLLKATARAQKTTLQQARAWIGY